MDLSIIIVNSKAKEHIDNCIKSIYDNTDKISFEIIVVDNNSNDGSIEMLKEKYPDVKTYQNSENVGLIKANNLGIRLAAGRYILLLSPYNIIHDRALEKMVDFMDANSDVGISGCRVEKPNGMLKKSCRRSLPTPVAALFKLSGFGRLLPKEKMLARYRLSDIRENKEIDVDSVSTAFLMFRSCVLEDVRGLDEDYSMYGEDIDFCYRAKKKRWKVKYYPEAKVVYANEQRSRHSSLAENKAYFDAIAMFYGKHLERKTFWPLRFLVYLGIWVFKQFAILRIFLRSRKRSGTKELQ